MEQNYDEINFEEDYGAGDFGGIDLGGPRPRMLPPHPGMRFRGPSPRMARGLARGMRFRGVG